MGLVSQTFHFRPLPFITEKMFSNSVSQINGSTIQNVQTNLHQHTNVQTHALQTSDRTFYPSAAKPRR